MKRIIYSDTEYFYSTLQKALKDFNRIEIVSDYKTTRDIPLRFLQLLRFTDKAPGFRTRKFTGEPVNQGHRIEMSVDKFNRLIFIITSMYTFM